MFIRLIAAVMAAWLFTVAAPAGAQEATDAERRAELADRLIRAIDMQKVVSVTIEAMPELLASEMSALSDEERDEAMAVLDDVMAEVLPGFLDRFLAALAPVYAETFTVAELEHMIGFYDTPIGQTILEKSYALGVETEIAMRAALPQTMREIAVGFCNRMKCDPQEMIEAMGVQ